MKCEDIMTKSIKMCDSNCTAKDAAQIMKKINSGVVPIVDEKDHVIGIVTDRDITLHTVAEGKDPSKVKIHDFMTKHVVTVQESDLLDDAIHKMKENKVRRLPVVNENSELTGIISIGDIAVLTDAQQETFEALEQISEPISGAK